MIYLSKYFRRSVFLFPLTFMLLWVEPVISQYKLLNNNEKLEKIEKRNTAFQALNVRVRDPFILLAPDGFYYLTGTTGGSHWGDTIGIKLWRSADLANWTDMGYVWDLYRDGKQANSWHFSQTVRNPEYKNPLAIWAPEIHFVNGTYWLTHSLNVSGHGLLKSVSGKPEGPYEVLPPVQTKMIDSHLFIDTDSAVYYCWQADYIARLNNDMSAIVEEPFKLEHNGKHPLGYEGIQMIKIGDVYVHIASGRYGYEPTDSYDLYYATSKKLYGSYGKRKKLAVNAGHGNVFQDKTGKWWITAFDHEFYDKKTMDKWSLWLVPIDIKRHGSNVVFHILDDNFEPKKSDRKIVKQLAKTGIPEAWKGKQPWIRIK